MVRIGLAVAAMSAGLSMAYAENLPLASRIETVTVFPQGAEVTRGGEIDLPGGSHTVVLGDLPADIVENSIRVEGEGGAEIGSVDSRRIVTKKPGETGPDTAERLTIERQIEALRDEKAALQGAIDAANAQRDLALNLTRLPTGGPWPLARGTGPGEAPPAGDAAPVAAGWDALFDLIGTRIAVTAKVAAEAGIAQRRLDERIKVLEERLGLEPPEEWERTEVRIFIEAAAAARGRLRVRYQTRNAAWQAIYDARLTTPAKDRDTALAIVRRAEIEQSTGEDWTDVRLTLSTTRPGGATAAPALPSLRADFTPPPQPMPAPRAMLRQRSEAEAPGSADADAKFSVAPMAAAPAMAEQTATADISAYQAAFTLPRPASVKSGVGAKRIQIMVEAPKAQISVRAVPVKDSTAYLVARFTHDSAVPLLPGSIALYRDGVYVGQGAFPLVARGEERELGFGPDDAVKVTRVEVKRAKGESGLIATSATDEQHYKTTIRNGHDRPVEITLVDRIPVSDNEKIAVELLPMTTEPTTRNLDDKPGVLAWSYTYKPEEEREIALSYELRWPAKQPVSIGER